MSIRRLQELAGIRSGRPSLEEARGVTEEEQDPIAFNTALAKELKKLKKTVGARSIKQGYRGTGRQKFRRQIWVRFPDDPPVTDVWLELTHTQLGGVISSAIQREIISHKGKTPQQVAKEVERILKSWRKSSRGESVEINYHHELSEDLELDEVLRSFDEDDDDGFEEARKLSKRAAEKMYDKLFKKHGHGVQFDIFDLGKMSKEVTAALMAGEDGEEAMQKVIKKYRKN